MFKNLREDGKDSTILYTDPHYFGRVWIAQMQKEFEANNRVRFYILGINSGLIHGFS